MAWGRIDDKLYSHRKTMRIPRAHRCEAMGLWVLADSWCNNHGTDGNVPRDILDEFGTSPEIAQLLVDAGYWVTTEEGYQFVNWGDFNLTSDDLEAKRSAEAERKRKWRESKKAKSEASPANVPAGQDGTVPDVPDGPAMSPLTHTHTHTQKNSSSKSSTSAKTPPPQEIREDVEALCVRLRDRIAENGTKATITAKWRTEARLLLDRDERDLDKALNLIDWCQRDSFWRSNVLSMPAFRKQYDRMRLKALEAHSRSAPPAATQGPSRADQKVQNYLDMASRLTTQHGPDQAPLKELA